MPAIKGVARKGQVEATKGDKMYSPATEGKWSPGEVKEDAYSHFTIGDEPVIYAAKCTFTFENGKNTDVSPPVPVPGTSDVTLEAGGTTLQSGSTKVLRDGDSNKDSYGNTLKVSADNALRSD